MEMEGYKSIQLLMSLFYESVLCNGAAYKKKYKWPGGSGGHKN